MGAPKRILATDPGGTTGWALLAPPAKLLGYGQVAGSPEIAQRLLAGLGPEDELVIESFRLRLSKAKALTGSDLLTAQIIGALEVAALAQGVPYAFQDPSYKTSFPDRILKALDVYVPKRHARDAIRHALYRSLFRYGMQQDAAVQAAFQALLEEDSGDAGHATAHG